MKTLTPLPPIAELTAMYAETQSIKAIGQRLHITPDRISRALKKVGVEIINPKNASNHKCFTCRNARADRCKYMAADIDGAEAVLVAMGAEYTAREYTYKYVHATRTIRLLTVRGCPGWREGSVAG